MEGNNHHILVDRFPVKDLPNRYRINRSVVYNRIDKLGIKPTKDGNQSFISMDDLDLLDRLDQWLKNKGSTGEFIRLLKEQGDVVPFTKHPEQTEQTQVTASSILNELIRTAVEFSQERQSILSDLRNLQEIADNAWLVTTSRLSQILQRPRSFFRGKTKIHYSGFILEKCGKQGNEALWQVSQLF